MRPLLENPPSTVTNVTSPPVTGLSLYSTFPVTSTCLMERFGPLVQPTARTSSPKSKQRPQVSQRALFPPTCNVRRRISILPDGYPDPIVFSLRQAGGRSE